MRILLAAHRNEAPGIATVMRSLSESLPLALDAGDELVVIGGGAPPRVPGAAQVRRRSKPAAFGGRYGRFAYEQGAIPALARSMDLVHMGDCRPLLLSDQAYVVTVHDLFFLDVPVWLPASVRRFKTAMLKAAIAKRPAAIVCVSEYTRSRLLAHVPVAAEFDLRVIHPAIAPAVAPVPLRRRRALLPHSLRDQPPQEPADAAARVPASSPARPRSALEARGPPRLSLQAPDLGADQRRGRGRAWPRLRRRP